MNYIKKIKEFLKDPKKKSLTQLGIYAVFFIFVFALLSSGGNSSSSTIEYEEKKSTFQNYKEMTSYNYKITYTSLDNIDIVEGTYFNNTSLFTLNNNKYYFENEYYLIDNDSYYLYNIQYNVLKLFNVNLYNIFEYLEEESKTTYKDGKIETNYFIDTNKFYNYYYDLEGNYQDKLSIKITEVDNFITKIEINLININDNLNNIEIEYNDINNITSLDFNKDNYTYKEM